MVGSPEPRLQANQDLLTSSLNPFQRKVEPLPCRSAALACLLTTALLRGLQGLYIPRVREREKAGPVAGGRPGG